MSFDDNGISNVNQAHLIRAPKVEDLKLKLSTCQINLEGIKLLAQNNSWINIQKVDLSGIGLRPSEAIEIGKNTSWTNLRSLDLSDNSISDEGCLGLSHNSSWKFLKNLNLSVNHISDKGFNYLSQTQIWIHLEEINLNQNISCTRGLLRELRRDYKGTFRMLRDRA